MNIVMPDPHPGRCKNWREGERCLDYDEHDSRCSFRERVPLPDVSAQVSLAYAPHKPQPWVSPLDNVRDGAIINP